MFVVAANRDFNAVAIMAAYCDSLLSSSSNKKQNTGATEHKSKFSLQSLSATIFTGSSSSLIIFRLFSTLDQVLYRVTVYNNISIIVNIAQKVVSLINESKKNNLESHREPAGFFGRETNPDLDPDSGSGSRKLVKYRIGIF